MKRKTYDPLLRVQPWRVMAVFQPLERVLARLEIDGTVDTDGRQVVFKEGTREDWYDLPAAIRGVVQFHELAGKHGQPVDVTPLERSPTSSKPDRRYSSRTLKRSRSA